MTSRFNGRGRSFTKLFDISWLDSREGQGHKRAVRLGFAILNAYQKQFGDKLVVIGITDQTKDAVRKLTNPKIEYSIAIDTQARTKKVVGVTGIPHVMLIDPQGYVRWEGFPFLAGHELNANVVADIIARYSN